jgi:nitroimidazol reductase NimA-like FMN-containing flavoprotein (pyridoxamine 5'-phosphate oxidase superfamily)
MNSQPTNFTKTDRNTVKRMPQRGDYDRATIYPIIDEALICHVGFVQDGQPYVIPTIHARREDTLFLHGAKASRLLKQMASGEPLCITVTHLDGLVLARSTFHSSMNYRSAVIFGRGALLEDEQEKLQALEAITEHLMPGRWADTRQPTALELKGTSVVAVTIESASAKIRTGPPADDEEDYALPMWAGVLPLQQQWGQPVDDPRLSAGIGLPTYFRK